MVRLFLPFNNPDTVRTYSLQYIPTIFSRHRLKPMGQIVEEDSSKAVGAQRKDNESTYRYFINDVGYRGRNFALRKPEGLIRIVILGGSAVFDGNARDPSADDGRDWPHLVERLLRSKGHNNVEVINAGIPGHASFDSLGRLYSQLWIYQPDYVLLYNAWNDIKYFTKLSPEKPLISLFEPLDPNGNPFTEYQGLLDRFLSNSQFYVKLRNRYYGWKLHVGDEGAIPEGEYKDNYNPYAVRQYRLNVELIVDACKNIRATPVLLTQATLVSPNNSAKERKLIRYEYVLLTHSALVRAFDDTYDVMRSVAREKRVPILDLAKELNGRRELFLDTVHLTTHGSEKVATLVATFLASYLETRSGQKRPT